MEDQVVFEGMYRGTGLTNAEGTNTHAVSKWEKVGTATEQVVISAVAAPLMMPGSIVRIPWRLPRHCSIPLRRYPQGDGS